MVNLPVCPGPGVQGLRALRPEEEDLCGPGCRLCGVAQSATTPAQVQQQVHPQLVQHLLLLVLLLIGLARRKSPEGVGVAMRSLLMAATTVEGVAVLQ